MSEHLGFSVTDHVATVEFKRTTMAPQFFRDLAQCFRELNELSALRAVIIRGAGKVFSYGLDLPAAFAELGSHFAGGGMAAQKTEFLALVRELQESVSLIARCPVPTIAAVHGYCIGGGLDVVTACDMRLATSDATFSLRETRIAIVADLGSLQRLPRIVGRGQARELAFTGRDIDADHALSIGLVNRCYQDRDALVAGGNALAAEIANNAPLTVRGVKQVLDYSEDKSVADGLEYVAAWNCAFLPSEDLTEAITAFMAKRPPVFKGK